MSGGSVEIRNLVKTYLDGRGRPTVTAVKNINLHIKDGEFMVLVGPSGCGKSTTLRMIAGLEKISSGTIQIGGRVVNDLPPKDRGIAMVFQNDTLYPHMTIYENLAFGLKRAKKDKAYIKENVTLTARTLGLSNMLDRKPHALSGGERQRVALGRAIVRNPKVFLFDEPLSNLDARMRHQLRSEISQLHGKLDATMVYVTHNQGEAMTIADRICVMKDGLIMQVADPLTLYCQPENTFVASFIGSPPMNLLRGRVTKRDGEYRFVEDAAKDALGILLPGRLEGLAAKYVDKSIIFGIRPEHITNEPHSELHVRLHATVEMSEPIGSECLVYLKTGVDRLIARVPSEQIFHMGDHPTVFLAVEKVRLFDPESEKVVQ